MKRFITNVVSLILVAGFGVLACAAQESSLRGLDEYITKSMAEWGTPGVSIAIIRDDAVIYMKGYGVRELGKPDRVDENTLFAIGSQTKPFTTAALSILADDGRISWDDRVTMRLPGFRLSDPITTEQLTIRDLASHRSGLPANNMIFWGTNLSRKDIVERLRYLQPTAAIRTRFQYNNLGYITAGEIIPAVTGKSWDDFVRERIFTPLGMTRSETSVTALLRSGKPNIASPHARVAGQMTPVPWLNLDNAGPAGSIVSSAAELAQWLRMQLGNGNYNGKQIISTRLVEEMHSAQMIMPRNSFGLLALTDTNFATYGLGWVVHDYRDNVVVEHGGQTDAMRSMALMVPARRIGVVVLTNEGMSELPAAIAYNVMERLLGLPVQDWSTLFYQRVQGVGGAPSPPPRIEGTRPSVELSNYAGTYRNPMYGDAQVSLQDGKLTLQILGFTLPLEHWHYDTFRITVSNNVTFFLGGMVTFSLNRNAEVAYLYVPGGGPVTSAGPGGTFVRVRQ